MPDGDPSPTSLPPRARTFFLFACFLHGLAYLLLLPPWMGEDEPWQFEYVHHVAQGHMPTFGQGRNVSSASLERMPFSQLQVERRFPSLKGEEIRTFQVKVLESMQATGFFKRVDWTEPISEPRSFDQVTPSFSACNQPPLYYLVAGTFVRLSGAKKLLSRLYVARTLSLAFYLATCALALAAARRIFFTPTAALLAAGFVAWLPIHARQAAVVNNDALAKLVVSTVVYLAVRHVTGSERRFVSVGLVLLAAAGLLVKTTAAGALAVLALAFLLRAGGKRAAVISVACALVLAVLGTLIWMGSHNPAVPRNLEAFQMRIERGLSLQNRIQLWITSIGAFNWESRHLPGPVYLWAGRAFALLGALSVVACFRAKHICAGRATPCDVTPACRSWSRPCWSRWR